MYYLILFYNDNKREIEIFKDKEEFFSTMTIYNWMLKGDIQKRIMKDFIFNIPLYFNNNYNFNKYGNIIKQLNKKQLNELLLIKTFINDFKYATNTEDVFEDDKHLTFNEKDNNTEYLDLLNDLDCLLLNNSIFTY